MPARRLPDAVHKAKGTLRADRHGMPSADLAATPGEPVGPPPPHVTGPAAEVWRQLTKAGHWLRAADRAALEVAVWAMIRLRGGSPTAAELSAASKALAQLGLSPAARGAVHGLPPEAPPPPGANPLDEFSPRLAKARAKR